MWGGTVSEGGAMLETLESGAQRLTDHSGKVIAEMQQDPLGWWHWIPFGLSAEDAPRWGLGLSWAPGVHARERFRLLRERMGQ